MRTTAGLLSLALALSTTTAHPHHELSAREVASHQAINKRCAAAAGAFSMARKKRSLNKRSLGTSIIPRTTNYNITTEDPHYTTIQNDTCVLVPDVTAGPYVWPRSETLRQDMREDQVGIPLYLDIGVLDVNTCEPAQNVMVDMWHCNATGSYSSFDALSPNTPFEELLSQLNKTIGSDLDLHTGDSTWLRGMWPTDSNGVMEMATIFPGFYVERTIHIHVQVHTDWSIRGNGTISASNIVSTGQLFFDEELSQQIMALQPYASHTQIERTTNDVDSIYAGETGTGWEPIVQVEALDGVDVTNGMVGYITLGVNLTATSQQGGGMGGGAAPSGAIPSGAAPSGA
ncbi:protocatechuate 3 [Lentithecium fluviatile CBS 122367]|uniref:Protocatechuate 3 n=1 Tax=Lentithecium fluviatile CBS 122367 TaxID=1168545 RepID=A0A6G1JMM9_9PLEO|nr:protocatechuate 3 [Lentithecium fluviatile CBS 122367]